MNADVSPPGSGRPGRDARTVQARLAQAGGGGQAQARPLYRAPWARRWALVVVVLMLAWTALAWQAERAGLTRGAFGRVVEPPPVQAKARAGLVVDGLGQGLAQLGGVAQVVAHCRTC